MQSRRRETGQSNFGQCPSTKWLICALHPRKPPILFKYLIATNDSRHFSKAYLAIAFSCEVKCVLSRVTPGKMDFYLSSFFAVGNSFRRSFSVSVSSGSQTSFADVSKPLLDYTNWLIFGDVTIFR